MVFRVILAAFAVLHLLLPASGKQFLTLHDHSLLRQQDELAQSSSQASDLEICITDCQTSMTERWSESCHDLEGQLEKVGIAASMCCSFL